MVLNFLQYIENNRKWENNRKYYTVKIIISSHSCLLNHYRKVQIFSIWKAGSSFYLLGFAGWYITAPLMWRTVGYVKDRSKGVLNNSTNHWKLSWLKYLAGLQWILFTCLDEQALKEPTKICYMIVAPQKMICVFTSSTSVVTEDSLDCSCWKRVTKSLMVSCVADTSHTWMIKSCRKV